MLPDAVHNYFVNAWSSSCTGFILLGFTILQTIRWWLFLLMILALIFLIVGPLVSRRYMSPAAEQATAKSAAGHGEGGTRSWLSFILNRKANRKVHPLVGESQEGTMDKRRRMSALIMQEHLGKKLLIAAEEKKDGRSKSTKLSRTKEKRGNPSSAIPPSLDPLGGTSSSSLEAPTLASSWGTGSPTTSPSAALATSLLLQTVSETPHRVMLSPLAPPAIHARKASWEKISRSEEGSFPDLGRTVSPVREQALQHSSPSPEPMPPVVVWSGQEQEGKQGAPRVISTALRSEARKSRKNERQATTSIRRSSTDEIDPDAPQESPPSGGAAASPPLQQAPPGAAYMCMLTEALESEKMHSLRKKSKPSPKDGRRR